MELVTLGGCHLLDGLVVDSVEARKEIVRGSGEELVRGVVLAPREPRRATIVKTVSLSCPLLREFLRSPVEAWLVNSN